MLAASVADAKTEPASQRTLERARARGDAPFTYDWTLAAVLLGSVASSTYAVKPFVEAWSTIARRLLSGQGSLSSVLASELAGPIGVLMLIPYLSVLAVLIAQRGATWAVWRSEPAYPGAAERDAPLARMRRTSGNVLKLAILAWVLGVELYAQLGGLLAVFQRDPAELLPLLLRVARVLSLRAAVVLIALGALDLLVQQVLRLRRLRMSRREALEEQRETTGDPHWLAARRARGRTLVHSVSLPLEAATLVITGQERAVALRYVPEETPVPVLWAKGEGAAAVALLSRAYALDLPLATDDALSVALYALEAEQPISDDLHEPVASYLAEARARG